MKRLLSLILILMMILPCVGMISVSAEGVSGEIEGARLNVGETLTFDYYATFDGEAKDVSMRFYAESGATVTVQGQYDEEYKMYKFPFCFISPQRMTENIKAELLYKGEIVDVADGYSVKKYCTSLVSDGADFLGLTKTQFAVLKRLMADMLVFGSEAQRYTGNKTDSPADVSRWVVASKGKFEMQNGTRTISGNANKDNRVVSVSLELSNVVRLCFKLKMYDDSTYVTLNGRTYQRDELVNNGDGTYYLYSDDISATEFDKEYNLKLYFDGFEASEVIYSVNGYIKAKYNEGDVEEIVKLLSSYGASAKKYQRALENSGDGDFDLDGDNTEEEITNIIPSVNSDFTSATGIASTSWSKMGNSVTLSIGNENGNKYLLVNKTPNQANTTYHTPMLDIAPYVKKGGVYKVSFKYKLKGSAENSNSLYAVIRTRSETSFSKVNGTNYFLGLSGNGTTKDDQWYTYTDYFFVENEDIGKGGTWNFGFHQIKETVSQICIDDVVIEEANVAGETDPISVNSAETWVANEVLLVADKEHKDAFYTVEVDLLLTNGITSYTIPAFWDGNSSWRARFVCPTEGEWTYTTVCSDATDEGLHGVTNTLTCTKYSGDLEIYKRGFVKTEPNVKHFMYADGTPFFYLGDTHWSLGSEPLEMVQTVVDTRVSQGYTVFQSEPLGVSFNFKDGISGSDIDGLRKFDSAFKIIADAGMVHANAQFFFPSTMNEFVTKYGGYSDTVLDTVEYGGEQITVYEIADSVKEALEKISRYWVARYSAYPVMWTLGQEVDNDFYWNNDSTPHWNYINNPYKYVAEYVNKYDPYKSPLSGHQEGHSSTAASNSAFRDVEAHTWYASQWKPAFKDYNSTAINTAKDYWNNGQGKPVVNYEGRYCYLWTKNFGARAQGWMSFLSGMFGHGYGAQDTWCYLSTYSENENTDDGVDIVTKEEKQSMTWKDALEFESGIQMGYMRSFFEDTVGDWWNLIPRFNDTQYLTRESRSYAYIASNKDNTKIVTYYYNFSDTSLAQNVNSSAGGTRTGTYGKLLPNTKYNYKWFNPITGEFTGEGTFTSSSTGTWKAGTKATCDMVLYIYR